MASLLYWVIVATAGMHWILGVLILVAFMFRLKPRDKRVCIVVLGDIGRSPRMQNHARSFADANFQVDIVGFAGSELFPDLQKYESITTHIVASPITKPPWMPSILHYVLKTVTQALQIFLVLLLEIKKPSHILVQNPPSIPTLAVVWLLRCLKGSSLIIDWHNYAYSILSMNLKSKQHPLVKFAQWYEGFFGRLSDKNICVTKAMKRDLESRWGIEAEVLYDRPSDRYKPISNEDKHKLFCKLSEAYPFEANQTESETKFTELDPNGSVVLKNDRPAILFSSTSWTEDEDFSILLNALRLYNDYVDQDINESGSVGSGLPNIFCVITGKGPMKDNYLEEINRLNLAHVTFVTPWLQAADYPKMVACGDIGVCLHTSSSGLDLPMKVVDMFGCQLPALAVGFPCLDELVQHGQNGLIFGSSTELAEQLRELFKTFPKEQKQLDSFRDNLLTSYASKKGWSQSWSSVVLPLLD